MNITWLWTKCCWACLYWHSHLYRKWHSGVFDSFYLADAWWSWGASSLHLIKENWEKWGLPKYDRPHLGSLREVHQKAQTIKITFAFPPLIEKIIKSHYWGNKRQQLENFQFWNWRGPEAWIKLMSAQLLNPQRNYTSGCWSHVRYKVIPSPIKVLPTISKF